MAQDRNQIILTALNVVSIVSCLAAGMAALLFKSFQMPLARSTLVITTLLLIDGVLQLVFAWIVVPPASCRIGGIVHESINVAVMLCLISIAVQMLVHALLEWHVEDTGALIGILLTLSLVTSVLYGVFNATMPPKDVVYGRDGLWCSYQVVNQTALAFVLSCAPQWLMVLFVVAALWPMLAHFRRRDALRTKEKSVSEDAIVRDQLSSHIRTGMVYLNVLALFYVVTAIYRNLYFISRVPPALVTVQVVARSSQGLVQLLVCCYLAYYYSKKQRKAKAKLKVMNSRGNKKKFATIDLGEERQQHAPVLDAACPASSSTVMAMALAAVREEKRLAHGQC